MQERRTPDPANASQPTRATSAARTATLASVIGSVIEWYDFFIYGTAAALVFNHLFFPDFDPLAGTLLAFSTFAVGFLARPIGGVVLGRLGDRVGRKATLVITLVGMGLASCLTGLLPGYDSIGVAAPVLLVFLRFVQGVALGGEYGGAVLMAVEHAPVRRRGLFGGLVQVGAPVGLLLANGSFAVASSVAGDGFETWGWRVPFLVSFVLVILGLVIRLKISESPEFTKMVNKKERAKSPIAEVLRRYPRRMLLLAGSYMALGATFYVVTVFGITYATSNRGVPQSTTLIAMSLACVVPVCGLPLAGALSDRFGRKPVMGAGLVLLAVMIAPWLLLVNTGNIVAITLAYALAFLGYAVGYGAMASFYAELFAPRVRYTALSLGYTIGTIIGGAFVPLISTSLFSATGSAWSVVGYVVISALISLLCLAFLPETARPTEAQEELEPEAALDEATP
jgi:MFS family permease